MVTNDVEQWSSEILHVFIRAHRVPFVQVERYCGGTERVAVTFLVRVSGCDAYPIGIGVIGATRGG